MTIRERFGRFYRAFCKATRYVGVRRLPVCRNGTWTTVPVGMWNGFRSVYEPYMEKALARFLKPGDVFFDIGAHFGIWSAVASRLVGPTGTVVACEPSPAFQMLQAHVARRANVRTRNVALGSRVGVAEFYAQGLSASGSLHSEVTNINWSYLPDVPVTKISVPMMTLDRLASEEGLRPSLIKIDVEGYELEVLRGGARLLEAGTACVIEIHPPQLALFQIPDGDVPDFLTRSGYCVEVIDRNPNSLYTVLATRRK